MKKEAWNKGKKMPHSEEWERNRLEAVRRVAKTRIYPVGIERPRAYVQPMIDASAARRKSNPDKYNKIAIANLPKDVKGAKNGNWQGGKTALSRNFTQRNTVKLRKWRRAILRRDGYECRNCRSGVRLEAHHIIPLAESTRAAFLLMNGVILCRQCHQQTDSWASKGRGKNNIDLGIGRSIVLIRTIPHKFQAYDTVGNWAFTDDGLLVVFVSEMSDTDMEMGIAIHEATEAWLCRKRGITQEQVDRFDMGFTGDDEPGDSTKAPYHKEHRFASKVERPFMKELGIDWDLYEKRINDVCTTET